MKGITQKQLAEMIGTKQPSISRLENNEEETTLKMVGKIAYALGYRAKIELKKIDTKE